MTAVADGRAAVIADYVLEGRPRRFVTTVEPLREALITRDRRTVYRVDDGIPVLLIEEGIAAAAA